MTSYSSQCIKALNSDGTIRAVGLQATELVNEVAIRHGLVGEYAKRLGEALIGGLMLSTYMKKGNRVNLNIKTTQGPVGQIFVDATPDGNVRGYIVKGDGQEPVKEGLGPWGEGILSVLRSKDVEQKEPFIGTVPLITGHFAKDLTFYWHQSEQVPSAVGLHIEVSENPERPIKSAGGFLMQALPGANEDVLKDLEQHIDNFGDIALEMAENSNPKELLPYIFKDTGYSLLEETPLTSICSCSIEKVSRAFSLLPMKDIDEMIQNKESPETKCEFCGTLYQLSLEDLKKIKS
ncbi:MAG: hypothetical protein CL678_00120 [Bdellovibrionaceae bacterium]|nr:hypothetical protein [Pseudobdellovibrionaceae bacterium]|tara:strand:- start:6278 stop:7153 length:876 start_codon:yes stop_codon:yes gene_type:complete